MNGSSDRTTVPGVRRLALLLALVVLPLVAAGPAAAAFPGANGRIAYSRLMNASTFNYDIWTMRADGALKTRLTKTSAPEHDPTWSPDGSRIAFVRWIGTGFERNAELYVMRANGTGVTRLTTRASTDWAPSWSPDGKRLAFASDRDGDFEIYVVTLATRKVAKLTSNGVYDDQPAWSPKGTRISFQRGEGNASEIWRVSPSGLQKVRLTQNSVYDGEPSFSPSGVDLVFTRGNGAGGTGEIWVMRALDGDGLGRLTQNARHDGYPAWSPNGKWIAFMRSRENTDLDNRIWVLRYDGETFPATTQGARTATTYDAKAPDWQPLP